MDTRTEGPTTKKRRISLALLPSLSSTRSTSYIHTALGIPLNQNQANSNQITLRPTNTSQTTAPFNRLFSLALKPSVNQSASLQHDSQETQESRSSCNHSAQSTTEGKIHISASVASSKQLAEPMAEPMAYSSSKSILYQDSENSHLNRRKEHLNRPNDYSTGYSDFEDVSLARIKARRASNLHCLIPSDTRRSVPLTSIVSQERAPHPSILLPSTRINGQDKTVTAGLQDEGDPWEWKPPPPLVKYTQMSNEPAAHSAEDFIVYRDSSALSGTDGQSALFSKPKVAHLLVDRTNIPPVKSVSSNEWAVAKSLAYMPKRSAHTPRASTASKKQRRGVSIMSRLSLRVSYPFQTDNDSDDSSSSRGSTGIPRDLAEAAIDLDEDIEEEADELCEADVHVDKDEDEEAARDYRPFQQFFEEEGCEEIIRNYQKFTAGSDVVIKLSGELWIDDTKTHVVIDEETRALMKKLGIAEKMSVGKRGYVIIGKRLEMKLHTLLAAPKKDLDFHSLLEKSWKGKKENLEVLHLDDCPYNFNVANLLWHSKEANKLLHLTHTSPNGKLFHSGASIKGYMEYGTSCSTALEARHAIDVLKISNVDIIYRELVFSYGLNLRYPSFDILLARKHLYKHKPGHKGKPRKARGCITLLEWDKAGNGLKAAVTASKYPFDEQLDVLVKYEGRKVSYTFII
ncbi:hypothetical protein HK100_007873, partial [Physocladia obscura]